MKKVIISSILSTALLSALYGDDISNKMFGSFQIGFSHLNNNKEDKLGSISLLEEQENSSKNIQVGLGYEISKKIDLSLNYQRVFNDDVDLNNVFLQSRYKFELEDKSFIPYVGARLGYSNLSWDKAPILSANNDSKSGSYMFGLSTGVLFPLSKNTQFIIDYSLSYMGHKTNLQTTSSNLSEISHDYLNSISFGIKFNF